MKFTVYVEILSSERNKEELSGFDSIEFVGISLGKYHDRCGIISGIIFAGRQDNPADTPRSFTCPILG